MMTLYLILVLAACMDLKSYKVPNPLVIAGSLFGLAYHLTGADPKSVFPFFLYAFFIWIITIPLFCIHVIGGGDCKLFALCGLYTGFSRTISIGVYAFLSAGVICVLLLAFRQHFPKRKEVHKIHFSLFILIGVFLESRIGGVI